VAARHKAYYYVLLKAVDQPRTVVTSMSDIKVICTVLYDVDTPKSPSSVQVHFGNICRPGVR
jgi:hypothetical protein